MADYKVEIDEYVAPETENEFRPVVAALIEAKSDKNHDPRANVTVPAADVSKVKRRIRSAAQEVNLSARIVGETEPDKAANVRISFVLRPAITRKRDNETA